MTDIAGCLGRIRDAGFEPLSHFRVPKKDWFVHFYEPMKSRLREVRPKYLLVPKALKIIDTMEKEIDIYNRYSDCSGYEFYLMRKP